MENLIVYDFPGLDDTWGISYDLLNAAFQKNIIENANKVLFIFVTNQSIYESKWGESFVKLINQARSVYNVNAENSILITSKVEEK